MHDVGVFTVKIVYMQLVVLKETESECATLTSSPNATNTIKEAPSSEKLPLPLRTCSSPSDDTLFEKRKEKM